MCKRGWCYNPKKMLGGLTIRLSFFYNFVFLSERCSKSTGNPNIVFSAKQGTPCVNCEWIPSLIISASVHERVWLAKDTLFGWLPSWPGSRLVHVSGLDRPWMGGRELLPIVFSATYSTWSVCLDVIHTTCLSYLPTQMTIRTHRKSWKRRQFHNKTWLSHWYLTSDYFWASCSILGLAESRGCNIRGQALRVKKA